MPRGSNSEVEQERIRRGEHSDFRDGRSGQGARKNKELPAFHGKQRNSKSPPSPK